MQLTPHFSDTELGVAGCDQRIVVNATQLCAELLEPIRQQFGPIVVDDGYRNPTHNAAVGGAADSQHLYVDQSSAADIRPLTADMVEVFSWIRLDSGLQFDQCILEVAHTAHPPVPRCIHLSYNGALVKQRRQALTGETNGMGPYTTVAVGP